MKIQVTGLDQKELKETRVFFMNSLEQAQEMSRDANDPGSWRLEDASAGKVWLVAHWSRAQKVSQIQINLAGEVKFLQFSDLRVDGVIKDEETGEEWVKYVLPNVENSPHDPPHPVRVFLEILGIHSFFWGFQVTLLILVSLPFMLLFFSPGKTE